MQSHVWYNIYDECLWNFKKIIYFLLLLFNKTNKVKLNLIECLNKIIPGSDQYSQFFNTSFASLKNFWKVNNIGNSYK